MKEPTHLNLPDGTCWPNPNDPNEVAYTLRYGTPDRNQLMIAASTMGAYRALIGKTRRRREEIVREIRKMVTHD